jgi:type II secretion system protein G
MLTNRKGFTLIELLIVVVIIGILAAIAIPKFSQTKDRAKLAAARSEVRNLMTAAEGYFSDAQIYPAALTDVDITSPTPSGVALTFAPAGAGYTATGTVAVSGGNAVCTVVTGTTAATEGIIQCVTP